LVDHAAARRCLLVNLLVLPGLGSLLAGRWVGWVQALLALSGFALTAGWTAWFVADWIHRGAFPETGGSHLWLAYAGILLFLAGWCWALATGLRLLRQAPR
jgi:hypothetical protein